MSRAGREVSNGLSRPAISIMTKIQDCRVRLLSSHVSCHTEVGADSYVLGFSYVSRFTLCAGATSSIPC